MQKRLAVRKRVQKTIEHTSYGFKERASGEGKISDLGMMKGVQYAKAMHHRIFPPATPDMQTSIQ